MKKIALLWLFVWFAGFIAFGQNPQSSTAPIYATNSKYVNGVAPGYYPTQQAVGSQAAQTGLHINVGPGTANCAGTIITYAGGTFTMTASAINYIYLNTASSCAVTVKTTSYTSSDIPVAMVTAGVSTLSAIADDRTIFNVPGSGSSGITSINGNTGAAQTFESLDSSVAITQPDNTHVNFQSVGGTLPTATAKGQFPSASGAGTTYTAVNPGVINVRTMFGGVPDGVTDNSTAIAAAFTAANAVTSGAVSVYFDCNGSTTTCQWNYGGAGTSPINPTKNMTVSCASRSVLLNYTGTAHAVDLHPSSPGTDVNTGRMVVENCGFTGGATMTQGIYAPNNTNDLVIQNNNFINFGPTPPSTAFSIYYDGYVSESVIFNNGFEGYDGIFRNAIFAAGSLTSPEPPNIAHITHNHFTCANAATGAVCTVPYGVGIDASIQSFIAFNTFGAGDPVIRIHGDKADIHDNSIEVNYAADPLIQFGNTNPVDAETVTCREISNNDFFNFNVDTGFTYIGPSIGAHAETQLSNCLISDNIFGVLPASGQPYVNWAHGKNDIWQFNRLGGAGDYIPLNGPHPAFGPTGGGFIQAGNARYGPYVSYPVVGAGVFGQGLAGFDTSFNQGVAGVMSIAQTLTCNDVSTSTTAKSCSITLDQYTLPYLDGLGQAFGAPIIFSSTTSNTGALTLNIDGIGANAVKKQVAGALVDLAAGDIIPNTPYLLMRDAASQWILKF